ncbi:MAG TPA: UvrD-helicase domain-containing protein [Anaerolineaceae bacterium]|nr:UvrD-helicase domain-containing protein [Anaerolineaceae bacterium]HPN53871.1 UvrD-helicase domain-containing protein [Anaerolineaceae bacterium]
MNTQDSAQQSAGNPIAHSSNIGLDPDQQAAVRHRGSNLLIIAGAGSGKTRTLTSRAISFLNEIPPENLMVVTFTKKSRSGNFNQNRVQRYWASQ